MDHLAAKSNYYYQMDAQRQTEKRQSNPKPTRANWVEHQIFCDQMGIVFPNGLDQPYMWRKKSYLAERKQDLTTNRRQYQLTVTVTTLFFLLQVIIGAIQTALGATRSPHLYVTIFGAIATVVGGILAYLKSRGQPNRARQLMNSLRKVVEEIEFQEIQLRNPEIKTTAKEAVDYINQLYEDARFQAETNYPDFWSTAGTTASKPGGVPTTSNLPVARGNPTVGQGGQGHQPLTQAPSNRPPCYHPSTQSQKYNPNPADRTANNIPADGGQPVQAPDPAAHIPAVGGQPLQAPDPAAHIHSEGGKSTQIPSRTARIPSQQGGRYMNERV